ncbi:MAG TPA: DUF418 domain-containing protein, partial [Gemmatimonadaceae bacterium]
QKMEIPSSGLEDSVGWFIWMGVETKSWATFAFLFGAGFAILMRRIEARGLKVIPIFLRRMLALAIIGVMVQLLTGFRILFEYAMWGVPLLFIRNLSTRTLLVIAVLASVAMPIAAHVSPPDRQTSQAHWRALNQAEENATFAEAVRARASFGWWWYTRPRTLIPDSNIVLFILGLLAVRLGIFERVRERRRMISGMMMFGLVSWTLSWFVFPKLGELFEWTGIISDQWLAFTYIGAVVLLLEYWPVWKSRLEFFGIAGRMALTNYIIQSTVLSILACGYGLVLKIRPYYVIPASIALFGACVIVSKLWLSRFRYGPMERMWRRATYGAVPLTYSRM